MNLWNCEVVIVKIRNFTTQQIRSFLGNIKITTKFDLQDVHNLWNCGNCEMEAEILFWILFAQFWKIQKIKKKYHWRNALQLKIQIFEWFSRFKMKNHKSHNFTTQHNFWRLFYNSAFNGCVMCSTICSFNFLKSKENLKLIKCAGKYWAHSIQWNAMMSLFDI